MPTFTVPFQVRPPGPRDVLTSRFSSYTLIGKPIQTPNFSSRILQDKAHQHHIACSSKLPIEAIYSALQTLVTGTFMDLYVVEDESFFPGGSVQ
ncbi:hypothetical protein M404DRAFT_1008325 [Pisolithus tinctorius Marx 270]|uniref:Uncharacterized protein n=1 Tax=Pisolithus tinctorius Marx 270 TaxID=870435 RepID=A0A0C3NG28_PISTI|nr:hypothetical protein M404DRAFT_1008325 [Pisolithus tinctorius Marx 270]